MDFRLKWFFVALPALIWIPAHAMDVAPLAVESKIMLGNVSGRIDHLAVDLKRQRLFVAELGNNTVGMIDLKERKVLRRISRFKEPQGVAYHASPIRSMWQMAATVHCDSFRDRSDAARASGPTRRRRQPP